MHVRNRSLHLVAALTLGSALALGTMTAPASASVPSTASAVTAQEAMLGTWVGSYSGFEDGTFVKGQERFNLTAMRGANVKGTWQFRATSADPWSEKSPMQLVVLPDPDGGWAVTGADVNGIYVGRLDASGTRLDLAYQGSVNDLISYHFVMRKR
jgi:hypothetical protein